jgi:hypothetical protein
MTAHTKDRTTHPAIECEIQPGDRVRVGKKIGHVVETSRFWTTVNFEGRTTQVPARTVTYYPLPDTIEMRRRRVRAYKNARYLTVAGIPAEQSVPGIRVVPSVLFAPQ